MNLEMDAHRPGGYRSRMQRTFARTVLGLFAIFAFLGAGTGDVLARHRCPHHDALPGGSAGVAADHAAHHATDAGQESDESHGACTCLGQCQTESGQSAPTALAATLEPILRHARERLVTPAWHASPPNPYLLPQANAPPLSA
jgi:hypothetical protein